MAVKKNKRSLTAREMRKPRVRKGLARSTRHQITVFRSERHTYAQLCEPSTGRVVFSYCTLQKEVQDRAKAVAPVREGAPLSAKSEHSARCVGQLVAERCKELKIDAVVFNRNGHLYHGRVKAVADGAREGGLQF